MMLVMTNAADFSGTGVVMLVVMMMAHDVIFFFSFLVMPWGRLLCRMTQTIHLGDRRRDRPFRGGVDPRKHLLVYLDKSFHIWYIFPVRGNLPLGGKFCVSQK